MSEFGLCNLPFEHPKRGQGLVERFCKSDCQLASYETIGALEYREILKTGLFLSIKFFSKLVICNGNYATAHLPGPMFTIPRVM